MNTPEYEVRTVQASEWPSVCRLRMARSTHAGHRVSTLATSPITGVDRRYLEGANLIVGKYQSQKLIAYVCCYSREDFWVLDLMVSSESPKDLQDCLEFCLVEYEKRGITQFFYAFPQKWARAYRSFWKSGVPTLRKYTIEDQCVIEPNRIPQDLFVWNHILHQNPITISLLLRRSYVQHNSQS